MDSFRRGRGLYDDIPWGGGVWAHGMGRAPPPSREGGFPEKQVRRCEGSEKKETTETDSGGFPDYKHFQNHLDKVKEGKSLCKRNTWRY